MSTVTNGATGAALSAHDADYQTSKAQLGDLASRMSALADEIMDPLLCRQPAYGAPGYAHCAACCYGTGYVVTCHEEQAMVDAAQALNRAAALLRASSRPVGAGAAATGLTRDIGPKESP